MVKKIPKKYIGTQIYFYLPGPGTWFKLSLIFCRKSSIAFISIEEHNFQLEIFPIKLIIQLKNNQIIINDLELEFLTMIR